MTMRFSVTLVGYCVPLQAMIARCSLRARPALPAACSLEKGVFQGISLLGQGVKSTPFFLQGDGGYSDGEQKSGSRGSGGRSKVPPAPHRIRQHQIRQHQKLP